MNKHDRFQNQPWYVRLWRRVRHQWRVPLDAARYWVRETLDPTDDDWPMGWRECWGVAVGMSHIRMNWLYDFDEFTLETPRAVKARLEQEQS